MKIGFDAKRIFHNTTGLGNYSRDTVRLLSNYYPDNRYLLYCPKPGKVEFNPPGNNTEVIYPSSSLNRLFSSYWRRKAITGQLKHDGLDVYMGLSNELPQGIEKTGIRSIVTIHDLIFMRFPEFYKRVDGKIYEYKFRTACQVSDQIIAVSEQTKKDIIAFFNIPEEKIQVVYQGCSKQFQKQARKEEIEALRKKYNLSRDYILTVGSIEKRKNLLQLLRAIKPLKTVNLVVIGRKTPYYQQVEEYIHKHQMRDQVKFFFGVPWNELPIFYQAAGLFVYPSVFEGFGIPIIEALFSKTPVISSTGSCFSEAGGPHSVYVDPHDPEPLTKAIEKIQGDNNLRSEMINKGFEYAQQFKDEHVAANLYKLIQKAVQ